MVLVHPLQSTGLKCVSLSAHVLVSVIGGPFDVYDVSYNGFPPLVVHLESVTGGPIDLKFSGGIL